MPTNPNETAVPQKDIPVSLPQKIVDIVPSVRASNNDMDMYKNLNDIRLEVQKMRRLLKITLAVVLVLFLVSMVLIAIAFFAPASLWTYSNDIYVTVPTN
ncbi:MAG: hypothetical protein ABL899_00385 [Nitrospira sp.]